ncbi:hypothetical protein N7455_009751 [Penicillium solitum]|uniref:uncharacterized protein n=1 Tax=Penicillium solitum TaxID=60172 RepID=UPI0017E3D56E|nr:hypothetical protein HAV15_001751 [Penicillium sp. str. \
MASLKLECLPSLSSKDRPRIHTPPSSSPLPHAPTPTPGCSKRDRPRGNPPKAAETGPEIGPVAMTVEDISA